MEIEKREVTIEFIKKPEHRAIQNRKPTDKGGLRVFIANVQGGTKLWSPRPNREVMRLSEPYQ